MFSLILSCLVSRDSDWHFSSGFRLMFPACWSAHDLKSLARNSTGVPCSWLLSLNNFFPCTSSGQVNNQCRSSSLLMHVFVTRHMWQQNTFCWIYSFLGFCFGLVGKLWMDAESMLCAALIILIDCLCCTVALNLAWFCSWFFFVVLN